MWMVVLTLAVAAVVAWAAVTRWTRVDDRVSRIMIAVGAFFAVAGPTLTFVVNPARAEAARMEMPLFRAIKKHEPALYEALRDDAMDRSKAGEVALLFRVPLSDHGQRRWPGDAH